MQVGLYSKVSNVVMQSVCKGMQSIGLHPYFRNPKGFKTQETEDFDIVVVLGLAGKAEEVRNAYVEKGIPVLVVDSGYILREQGYLQFGVCGLNWLPEEADHDRAKKIGLVAQNKISNGNYILIASQKPNDKQHGIDVEAWEKETIKNIQNFTNRQIKIRKHPDVQHSEITLSEDLKDCFCLITYNSTSAYEALMSGIPVICDEKAVYSDCCETNLENIEKPFFANKQKRQKLLDRVAYAQWKLSEIETGEPVKFLLSQINS